MHGTATQDAEIVLNSRSISDLYRDPEPNEIADGPIRERLRPCCAFGVDLGAQTGPVPVPPVNV